MNYKFIQFIAGFIVSIVLSVYVVFAQNDYTTLFSSINIAQWEMSGLVTPNTSAGTISFVFPYDEDAAREGVPDTVVLTVTDPIDLGGCSTIFVRYDKSSNYPNPESWIVSDIYIFARHEYNHSWTRVFEDISDLAGWIHELELQFRIVIKTDKVYPSTLILNNIRVEGVCI